MAMESVGLANDRILKGGMLPMQLPGLICSCTLQQICNKCVVGAVRGISMYPPKRQGTLHSQWVAIFLPTIPI